MAKSQTREPLLLAPLPNYPFESVVADHFDYGGHQYLALADRFTGWIEVFAGGAGTKVLIQACKDVFTRFGVPSELSSDGGPAFVSREFQEFLKIWGINHRLSSVAYPQSNGRAELAVKSAKRIVAQNTGPNGTLATDKARRSLLQYKNTPLQGIGASPAQLLFGRQLRDWTPATKDKFRVSNVWVQSQLQRELALARQRSNLTIRYNMTTRTMPPLSPGTCVTVQSQVGNHPTRWAKTGVVVQSHANRQYSIRMHGSGRVTLRNRRFLRPISPTYTDGPISIPGTQPPPSQPQNLPATMPTTVDFPLPCLVEDQPTSMIPSTTPTVGVSRGERPCDTLSRHTSISPTGEGSHSISLPSPTPTLEAPEPRDITPSTVKPEILRRSQRPSRPPWRLSPSFRARQSYT
jgi:hypothetical protein